MTAEKKTYRVPDFILPDKDMKSTRRFLGGNETTSFDIQLKTVTPILGGGYRARELDDVDIIRVPTIRGHLRFWWRALYAHKHRGSEELYKAECKLWGGAGGEDDEAGKSKVELCVEITRTGETNESDINLRDDSAYALWPARGEKDKSGNYKKPPAPRRSKTKFTLTVICPKNEEQQVRNTLKAWILFGGYGSRTRRGLGSLTVKEVTKNKGKEKETEDLITWLPAEATKAAINGLFEGLDPLGDKGDFEGDTPRLPGALLYVGKNDNNAKDAWVAALKKLKEFRQGRGFAREQGAQRPGRSRWPEADKIRHLTGRTRAHNPRFNNDCCWPRSGFGLPIGGQFVTPGEPDSFSIKWRDEEKPHDRLASPLILKPLPLTGDKFVPCALWLNRGYPKGEVFVDGLTGSEAPFDKLTGKGDEVLFKPLKDKETLREAFLDWLGKEGFKEEEE